MIATSPTLEEPEPSSPTAASIHSVADAVRGPTSASPQADPDEEDKDECFDAIKSSCNRALRSCQTRSVRFRASQE